MGLDENMKLATAAAGHARLKVPRSNNYKFTSSPIRREDGKLLYKATYQQLAAVRENLPTDVPKKDVYKEMAKRAIKEGAGNCHEVAIVAAEYLISKGATGVEIVLIVDAETNNAVIPHVVTVIGRQGAVGQGGDVGLPDAWGRDAVVCDPWDRVAYPASMYDTFWDGLKKASSKPNTLTCVVDEDYG